MLLVVSVVVGVRGLDGKLSTAAVLSEMLSGPLWLLVVVGVTAGVKLLGVLSVGLVVLLVLGVVLVCVAPSAATSSVLIAPMNTTAGVKPLRAADRSVGGGEKGGGE